VSVWDAIGRDSFVVDFRTKGVFEGTGSVSSASASGARPTSGTYARTAGSDGRTNAGRRSPGESRDGVNGGGRTGGSRGRNEKCAADGAGSIVVELRVVERDGGGASGLLDAAKLLRGAMLLGAAELLAVIGALASSTIETSRSEARARDASAAIDARHSSATLASASSPHERRLAAEERTFRTTSSEAVRRAWNSVFESECGSGGIRAFAASTTERETGPGDGDASTRTKSSSVSSSSSSMSSSSKSTSIDSSSLTGMKFLWGKFNGTSGMPAGMKEAARQSLTRGWALSRGDLTTSCGEIRTIIEILHPQCVPAGFLPRRTFSKTTHLSCLQSDFVPSAFKL
jgi:hypothetical protein